MRDQTRNIVCHHAYHVSFEKKLMILFWFYSVVWASGRLSKRVVLIFITCMVVYLFHTSGLFSCTSVHCFTRLHDQLGRTSEPSCENGSKLKPRGCHMATTSNSGQARKVVSVPFRMRDHIFHILWFYIFLSILWHHKSSNLHKSKSWITWPPRMVFQ